MKITKVESTEKWFLRFFFELEKARVKSMLRKSLNPDMQISIPISI